MDEAKTVFLAHEAIAKAEAVGLSVIHHACVLMYANPKGIHRFHGWLKRRFGTY